MPGIHKNNTISFRPNDWERELIDAKIRLSGLQKRDFFVRACLYANIVVVGSKENVKTIVDAVENMRDEIISIGEAIKRQDAHGDLSDFVEQKSEYLALAEAVVEILNGAAYLFEKEKPCEKK